MKHLYTLIFLALISFNVNAQNQPFITTWEVEDDRFKDIKIGTDNSYNYNYTIDFGDGTVLNNQTGDITHYYLSSGTYKVTISGNFPYGKFNEELISIDQWGDIQWQSMRSSFAGCHYLTINTNDAPDLTQVTDMSGMFSYCGKLNKSINHWDTSNVTNMKSIFEHAGMFNQSLSNWDVSKVTDMSYMFAEAKSFNQPLNNWDVSNVTDMESMFNGTKNFNQPLNNWDVSNVKNMNYMFSARPFYNSYRFNQTLNNWDTSSVLEMKGMFENNQVFNSAIGNWDVSKVTDMSYMFYGALNFNQDISNWNVSNVTDMEKMFSDATNFNQSINNWDVSSVINMSSMFHFTYTSSGTSNFNKDIGNWDVSNVTNMTSMFSGAIKFNQPIGNWDVSSVTNMYAMFYNTNFNKTLNNWDVSSVTNMNAMFYGSTFNQALDNWNVSNVTNMQSMFDSSYYNQPLNNWNVSNVTNMSKMFFKNAYFDHPLNNWNISNVTNMSSMFEKASEFNQPLDNWNVSNVTNMSKMFNFASLFNQNISSWVFNSNVNLNNFLDNSNINTINYDDFISGLLSQNIQGLALGAKGLLYCNETTRNNLINNNNWTINGDNHLLNCNDNFNAGDFVTRWSIPSNNLFLDITTKSNYNYNYTIDFGDGTVLTNQTGNVTHSYSTPGVYTVSISGTFPSPRFQYSGDKLISVEQWGDIQWQSMESAFSSCQNLVINATDAPDLSQVTDMSYMFYNAKSLNQSINHWDVSNITNMRYLFSYTENFNKPLNNWDVSNVTNMGGMFMESSSFNQPLNSWNVSNVTNINSMFERASEFNQLLNNWDISKVTKLVKVFRFAGSFDQPLNNWDVSNVTDMSEIFLMARNFNQPLNNWNVSNVTNMEGMFLSTRFNRDINNWDVSNVTDMNFMFCSSSFNQPLNNWDVSNVTNMQSMFSSHSSSYQDNDVLFNQPLNNWDVSNVTNMIGMFYGALKFNQDISSWNVSNTTSMSEMFREAELFNQPLNSWDVSNVTNMSYMFSGAIQFNQPVGNWDVSKVTHMYGMFRDADEFNQPLNNWNVSNVLLMHDMFDSAGSFDKDLSQWNFNQNVSFYGMSGGGFLSNTAFDIENYENLLARFVNLNLQNKKIRVRNLIYCNTTARDELINNLGWEINGDSQSQNCNSIIGEITYDENNDGCDPADQAVSGFMVNANDGIKNLKTYSSDGNYILPTTGTNFTVSVMNYPSYYSVSPASQSVTFTSSSTEVVDFCVTANQSIEDLNITLLPTSEARPGFEADYQLVVENLGTQNLANVSVTVDFDDAMQSFVSASVTPTSTTANQLTFDITNLQPLTNQKIDFTQQTFQPPTVNGDDILSFTATVTPNTNDNTPTDNVFNFDQVVVNSYDPNDKQVLQGEEIYEEETDEYLDYLIRFQNTGTASAINVRILDTLHPKLDYSTLKPVSASHNYHIEITDENQVEFIFDNINLPDENTNEPASHGFVAYKIKPKNDVTVGDFIEGDARIYFDFNAPIITNMTSTEIVQNLDIDSYSVENNIHIYPNPTKNKLYIDLKNNVHINEIKIYNLEGVTLMSIQENQKQLNLESLSAGIYFIKITTDQGVVTKRLLKE